MTRREERRVALLPEERAGFVPTTHPGAVLFSATLLGRPGTRAPEAPQLTSEPVPGARLFAVQDARKHASAVRTVSCEVRALRGEALGAVLDALLARVATHAALVEAVLEMHTVRLVDPSVTPPGVVGELARHLHRAGLPASFGPSWTPIRDGADVCVGTRGREGEFEALLVDNPAWRQAGVGLGAEFVGSGGGG